MRRALRMPLLLRCAAVLVCAAALLGAAPEASAQSMDEAKAAGQIGEGPDGFLHVVDRGAPAEVKALVRDINARRKASYEEIARKRGVPLDAVAAQAGSKLVSRTPAGQYVLNADGSWRKK